MQKNKPNILLIMTDQFRYDAMGFVSPWMKTPNIDQIFASGMSFSACYVNSPVCIPSRFALATGMSPKQLNITSNLAVDLSPHNNYWTNAIESAGYKTSVFGKTHLHNHAGDLRDREHLINSYGFQVIDEIGGPRASAKIRSNMTDLWQEKGFLESYKEDYQQRFSEKPFIARPSILPTELYADTYVGTEATNYLKKLGQSKNDSPWFCWTSFGGPHEPWDAPQPYADIYSIDSIPTPIRSRPLDNKAVHEKTFLAQRLKKAPKISAREVLELKQNYAGNVTLIDEQIGNMIRSLKEQGQFDNTIIIFTSDHGEMNGDHGLIYKSVFFESAVKVPLLVSTPEMRSNNIGKVTNTNLVQLSDLGPTLLDLANINSLNKVGRQFSKSFFNTIENQKLTHRKYLFSQFEAETMIFDGKYKMVVDKHLKPYLLFNLKNDPFEQHNLILKLTKQITQRRLLAHLKKYLNT